MPGAMSSAATGGSDGGGRWKKKGENGVPGFCQDRRWLFDSREELGSADEGKQSRECEATGGIAVRERSAGARKENDGGLTRRLEW